MDFDSLQPSPGGIYFDSSDATVDATAKLVNLTHITKPWTRDAWERAKPWILEQRQKLESNGWSNADGARTELFVLKKNAPPGSFTEDGSIYIRVPKKFIDFNRSGKTAGGDDAPAAGADEGAADGEEGAKKKKTSRISKKKENAPTYELNDPWVWRVKIDGADSEDINKEPNVALDVLEPMENILYLVMTLQPGLIRLHAERKDVVQPGTKQSTRRDDGEKPTIRHQAMVASHESYLRILPPAFWFKKNAEVLRKILSSQGNAEQSKEYDETLAAAENVQRSHQRTVKDVKEKTWEEVIEGAPSANTEGGAKASAGGKKGKAAKATAEPATAAV
ncbi:hypothetical protein FA10DRAFT_232892 [Acaromyces ingoldii]|uniref:Uncharacterized protein n=1 Tax=Acaromyces ingoldii TaxID=215250 RepID=A0A316YK52_9BASI|nr:hypothetical protein FA10DRAFT_232892 [Acaromyces ingoldii]PWN88095.1 hypothetical protein FA10DRAFT_232892 [Acaromyces ingoldii]